MVEQAVGVQQQPLKVYDNKLVFRTLEGGGVDGVQLNDDEKEYLLPHFLMLLVGKPGSGKTTLLKQLLVNDQMYGHKFNDVLLISPSHAKMGISVRKENITDEFSLDWLFQKFDVMNEEQNERVFGFHGDRSVKPKQDAKGRVLGGEQMVVGDQRARWLLSDAFASVRKAKDQGKKQGSHSEA